MRRTSASSISAASHATRKCALCTGSNVPPRIASGRVIGRARSREKLFRDTRFRDRGDQAFELDPCVAPRTARGVEVLPFRENLHARGLSKTAFPVQRIGALERAS